MLHRSIIATTVATGIGAVLACGGATSADTAQPEAALKVWRASPGPGEPEIQLRLVLDDRVVVHQDGRNSGELRIPPVPEARRDSPGWVLTTLDIDQDGLNDIGFRDDEASTTFNVAYAFYRYDHSSKTYSRCTDLDGWRNLEEGPDGSLLATELENGRGTSGTSTTLRPDGGCGFTPLSELTWEISPRTGNGTASCRIWSEPEPQWRMPVDARPTRPCPDPSLSPGSP